MLIRSRLSLLVWLTDSRGEAKGKLFQYYPDHSGKLPSKFGQRCRRLHIWLIRMSGFSRYHLVVVSHK